MVKRDDVGFRINLEVFCARRPKDIKFGFKGAPHSAHHHAPPLAPKMNGSLWRSVKHCSTAPHGLRKSNQDSKLPLPAPLKGVEKPSDSDFWYPYADPFIAPDLYRVSMGR